MRNNEDLKRLMDAEGDATERDMGGDYEPVPGAKVSRGHGRTRTLQVRLNEDEYAALEAFARDRELPVSTLVRSMLLPALKAADRNHPAEDLPLVQVDVLVIIERMRSELDLLSQRIAS